MKNKPNSQAMKGIITLIALLFFQAGLIAQTIYPNYTDGKIYVRIKNNIDNTFPKNKKWNNLPLDKFSFLNPMISKYGIQKVSKPFFAAKGDEELLNTYVVQFSNYSQVDNLMKELKNNTEIELVEKVSLMKTSLIPNDYATTGGNAQWHLQKINAPGAWDVFSTGSSIAVAVVDNAMQITHPDLNANMYTNPGEIANNGIDDDNNGYVDDVRGYDVADDDNNSNPINTTFDHGTHCSGLISACANNGTGIASIGFSVKIIPVKSTHDVSDPTAVDAGYAGIIYAVNAKARVISCSWGGGGGSVTEQAVINYAWNRNVIVVAAAGNDNSTVESYPGAYNNVYCVASTTSTDTRSSFSNYGSWVDIASPGSGIRSTLPGSTYGSMSGTSMATPIVAGLCGLMISVKPYLTPTQVLSCISTTAATLTATGMGAGRIDAAAAMACAASASLQPPIVNFAATTPVTCPGLAVQFTDLTFFGPTSWNWSFPGATPSTSTSQNPSVTYSAPGVYQVSLTAFNPNGSGTVTKNSYINVTDPIALPLAEGFVGTPYPPAGWSEYDFHTDSIKWGKYIGAGGYGTSSQCVYFDNYDFDLNGKGDDIRTPKYDFTNLTTADLKFDVAYARYDAQYSDSLKVMVSTDCGATWTQIYFDGGTTLATAADNATALFVPASSEWKTETLSLNAFVGQGSVMVAFRNVGRYGQPIYVDNINITGFTAGAPPTAVFSTSSNTCTNQTATLTDNSTNNPTAWAWTTTGGTLSANNVQNPTISFTTGGTYTITLVADNSFGSSAPVSQTITVNQTPNAVASATGPFCVLGQIALNASGTGTYLWNGPSGYTSTLQNPIRTGVNLAMSGVYTVTVTDNGCSATSTTSVTVANKPTSVISGSTTFCAGNSLTLSGSTSTGGGSYAIASYQWQLAASPISGANAVTYGATQGGVYSLIVTNSAGCTTTSANKTLTMNTPVTPTITSAGTVLTSSAAVAYQWYLDGNILVGETNQSITVTQNGDYTVQTTDVNGCTAISALVNINSIGINELTASINASVYPNPSNGMFTVSLNLKSQQEYKLIVTDVLGRVIVKEVISGVNHYTKQFDLSDKANGVYNLSIENVEQGKQVERIVINK